MRQDLLDGSSGGEITEIKLCSTFGRCLRQQVNLTVTWRGFWNHKKSWYFVYFNQCQGHTQSRTSKVSKGFEKLHENWVFHRKCQKNSMMLNFDFSTPPYLNHFNVKLQSVNFDYFQVFIKCEVFSFHFKWDLSTPPHFPHETPIYSPRVTHVGMILKDSKNSSDMIV